MARASGPGKSELTILLLLNSEGVARALARGLTLDVRLRWRVLRLRERLRGRVLRLRERLRGRILRLRERLRGRVLRLLSLELLLLDLRADVRQEFTGDQFTGDTVCRSVAHDTTPLLGDSDEEDLLVVELNVRLDLAGSLNTYSHRSKCLSKYSKNVQKAKETFCKPSFKKSCTARSSVDTRGITQTLTEPRRNCSVTLVEQKMLNT